MNERKKKGENGVKDLGYRKGAKGRKRGST